MAEAALNEVLASAAFQTCSEQIGQLVSKAIAIGAPVRQDLGKWPNGQVPAKWLLGDMAFEGDIKGNIYLAMEEKPFFAIGALLRDMAPNVIKERLAAIELNDSDIDGIREVANILSGALDDTLRNTTGKKVHLKLIKFDVASKMSPHPDANRIAYTAPIDVDGGLAKGSITLVSSSSLAEFLGVKVAAANGDAAATAQTTASAAGAAISPGDIPPDWWKLPAPKAASVILFGEGEAVEKAAAVATALKLACHRPKDEKELQEILAKDGAAAIFVHPQATKDAWLRVLAQTRKTPLGKVRRLLVSLPKQSPAWMRTAFAMPPTGVWAPPYDAQTLTKLLLAPLPCA